LVRKRLKAEIALVLNHGSSDITAVYAHGHPTALKLKLLCEWSDHVEQLIAPPPPEQTNVVRIRGTLKLRTARLASLNTHLTARPAQGRAKFQRDLPRF
jgi:hypothetical protein